jgi:hypothetical protein
LDLQLPVQSVPITTKVVSSNPTDGEVYSIQHYVIVTCLYILFKNNNHIETETTYMINQDDFFLLIPFDRHSNLLYVFLRFVHFSETISILQNYVLFFKIRNSKSLYNQNDGSNLFSSYV